MISILLCSIGTGNLSNLLPQINFDCVEIVRIVTTEAPPHGRGDNAI